MTPAKGFLQGTVIVLWAVYAVVRIASVWGRPGHEPTNPTDGAELLSVYLESLPIQSLVLATGVMVTAVVGLEVAFMLIRRLEPG